MELKVVRGGMLTTVQDLGRRGYRSAGVPLSGAMDPFALRIANYLVGNAEGAAALEFTLVGPDIEFAADALVAVTGAECGSVPGWRPLEVRAGDCLRLGACTRGCRGYLAVHGGIEVVPVLGSRSTYLRGGWGGFEGRAVREGDVLQVGAQQLAKSEIRASKFSWQIDPRMLPSYSATPSIRVTRGILPDAGMDELLAGSFTVSPQSDRMGLRLAGEQILRVPTGDLLSSAVVPGTIQVPPDGHPLILMADAQTIGGYPQVAHVICVDLPVVAQVRPGDVVRFVEVSLEEAHRLALLRDRSVAMLREGLAAKLGTEKDFSIPVISIDLNCDLGEGFGRDAQLMPLISSANIACGGHAGDKVSMEALVALAVEHGVGIGAHPSFADRENFGRREIAMPPNALREMVTRQISALRELGPVRHVKPHGALYNLAARDRRVADAIVDAVSTVDPSLFLFALAGSELVRSARERGLIVAEEVFADRSYQPDGSLTPRTQDGALIDQENRVVAQVLQMIQTGSVRSVDGTTVMIAADTVCLHGDGPHAVQFAVALRRELANAGIAVRAFRSG